MKVAFALSFYQKGRLMTKRMIAPLIFGVVGIAILLSLGTWQLRRMVWKEAVLTKVAIRLQADPVAIPQDANFERDNYLRVSASGSLVGAEIHILSGQKFIGPGFEIIRRLDTDAGPILVDLGFVPEAEKNTSRPSGQFTVTGNLLWPDDVDDSFTPDPDIGKNFWFARDVPTMAKHLSTQPILLVASRISPQTEGLPSVVPVAANISNRHLEYVITWFSLAVIWFGMTVYLLWRIRRQTV